MPSTLQSHSKCCFIYFKLQTNSESVWHAWFLFWIGFNVPFNTFPVISGKYLLVTDGMITTLYSAASLKYHTTDIVLWYHARSHYSGIPCYVKHLTRELQLKNLNLWFFGRETSPDLQRHRGNALTTRLPAGPLTCIKLNKTFKIAEKRK